MDYPEDLLDLLTTAATIGRNGELNRCQTRGDITEALKKEMGEHIDNYLAAQNADDDTDPGILQEREVRKARGTEGWDGSQAEPGIPKAVIDSAWWD
jgi:hypothetical protein